MEKFHHNGEIPSSKSVTQMMEFLQVKSPFIGVVCNPTVAIATKKELLDLTVFQIVLVNLVYFQSIALPNNIT